MSVFGYPEKGTLSHVVDPRTPGAVDTILHLGDCWKEADIKPWKEKIMDCNRRIGAHFASAYRQLAAASHLYRDMAAGCASDSAASAETVLRELRTDYLQSLPAAATHKGFLRKLFLTAVTPKGIVCHVPSFQNARLCVLDGPGFATGNILRALCNDFLEKGYNAEAFYNPLLPDEQIDHLFIPALSLLFATHDFLNPFSVPENSEKTITLHLSLDAFADQTALLERLLDLSVQTIRRAKSVHDELEQYYVPHMDFKKVNRIRTHLLKGLSLDS